MKAFKGFVILLLLIALIPTGIVLADTVYVVQPGDTLWEIAEMFGVSMEDIAAANNLDNIRVVYTGQELIIPGVDGPLGSQPSPTPPPPPAPTVPLDPSILTNPFIVQPPLDTLWEIAVAFGVSVEEIAAANNLGNIRVVGLGQELTIPGIPPGPLNPPTPAPAAPSNTAATPAPAAPAVPANPLATLDPSILTNPFTVQPPLDTLWEISVAFGVPLEEIAEENNLENIRAIGIGQVLYIPGIPLGPLNPPTPTTAPAAASSAPVAAAPAGANLLPNASFEGDWYFYLYNELQVPTGWHIATDEGPNTLDPFNDNLFLRPECRVVSTAALPPNEQDLFVFDGQNTVKVFKGGGPTSFSLFTDVYLQPGTYRMTINFFADTVISYNDDGSKVFATDPLSAEARIIKGTGGTGWTSVVAGQKNTLTYTFTVTAPGAVRVGGSFRNRYVLENNGWFLDDWSLVKVQ